MRATLDALAFDARSVTIAGEYDHPVSHSLIARTALDLDGIEVVLSHPQASAQCARFIREHLPERRDARRPEHRRGRARGERVRRALGGARRQLRGRASTAASSCARGSRTSPTTSPASSGSRPTGTSPAGRRQLADDADLLRARRGPPGRAGRRPDRVLQPRRQPHPDRVPAASRRARPLHVLRRPRGRDRRPGSPRRSRRCAARPSRCGCSAATRSTRAGSRAV